MSQDDYAKRAEAAADEYADNSIDAVAIVHGEDICFSVYAVDSAFKAGVQWARSNPPPEVMALVVALEELADICDDKESRKEIDSFTAQPARQALRRFEERR